MTLQHKSKNTGLFIYLFTAFAKNGMLSSFKNYDDNVHFWVNSFFKKDNLHLERPWIYSTKEVQYKYCNFVKQTD